MAKLIAAGLSLLLFNFIVLVLGFPRFGTFGFLLFVNALHALLIWGYRIEVLHERHAWARTISLLSILLAVVALFRANPLTLNILGFGSLTLTLISYYLFGLTRGHLAGIVELLTLPIAIVWSGIKLFFDFAWENKPTWQLVSIVGLPLLGILVLLFSHLLVGNVNHQRLFTWFGANLLFFSIVVVLFSIKIYNPIKDLFDVNYLRNAVIELTGLTSLCLIVLTIYLGINHYELFLITSSTSLAEFGFESIFAYVWDGFIKLTIVGAASFLLITAVYESCRQDHPHCVWLRSVTTIFTSVFALFVLSILKRLVWYVQEFGLTINRFYLGVFLTFLLAYSLLLTVRFAWGWFNYWRMSEMVLVLGGVFLLGMVNVEALAAERQLSQSVDEVDYYRLSQLSGDAASAWIVSYKHASQVVDGVAIGSLDELSPDEIDEIYAAGEILTTLQTTYFRLDDKYGRLRADLDPATLFGDMNEFKQVVISLLHINISQWHAYQLINKEIPVEELAQNTALSQSLISYYETGR